MEGVQRITTGRLVMRPYREEDLEPLWRLWTDPDVRRFLWDDRVIERGEAEDAMRDGLALAAEHGLGHWAVTLRDDPALIGFCGLRFLDAPPEVELLYGLAPAYWGRGLATEAARAWLERGFAQHGLARIWALTDYGNIRSEQVMQRLGMQFDARIDHHGLDTIRYVLTRDAFRALSAS